VKVGSVQIDGVIDGSILSKLHGTKAFPAAESALAEDQLGMLQPDGFVTSTLGSFVIRTAGRVVLVDAGAGQPFPDGYSPPRINVDDAADPIGTSLNQRGLPTEQAQQVAADLGRTRVLQGELPASLATLGLHPSDITDVVLTHLHFDHIGWVSEQGSPYFTGATIRCAAADLHYFLSGPDEEQFVSHLFGAVPARQRLAPVLDRIETWESDQTLLPGIDVRLTPGHTPGSSVVVVSDGADQAMLLGDIIHCPLELMDDDFDLLVDHDPNLAKQVREAYARELEGGAVPAAAAHFPGLRFGRLLPGEATRRWRFDEP
jgi:glyoxylase-like metal-dependent hydrolase (beta-lactamase superfamily II)